VKSQKSEADPGGPCSILTTFELDLKVKSIQRIGLGLSVIHVLNATASKGSRPANYVFECFKGKDDKFTLCMILTSQIASA
jgi:hypothetical protein